jgi:catechol 2,3-dioxygenase-like lactoylglutathione lyase family enzyme
MIIGAHTIVYAEDAEAARAFFRDVLDLPHVDAHGGWLIFALPPGELAVHPAAPDAGPDGRHELYLMCDDIHATVAALTAKGARFTGPVSEAGFGLLTGIEVPGAGTLGIYEPRHATAIGLGQPAG